MVIIEYCYGGRKGFIVIHEDMDRKGRRCFAEMLKVLGYANSSVSITNDKEALIMELKFRLAVGVEFLLS